MTKVGVVSLTAYLTDSLAQAYAWGTLELTDPIQVAALTTRLVGNLEPSFWMAGWKEGGGLDTPRGRQQVVEDLNRIALNHRAQLPWFEELRTVNRPEPVEA